MGFEPVIGLEIHARLLTNTKIFCGCSTRFGHAPNTSVCPVCLGFPGALPVLNRRAVDFAAKAALALNCTVHEQSIFARKNYFYPDLPKGYQISQYELPLATAGRLEYGAGGAARRVRITRVHLEEDAGKSLHEGFADSDQKTYLDYNRSGTPLIEIVTEPDLRSATDAANAFRKLREMLMALGVNDGNMEEGSLRCDANVSVRPDGAETLGTKTEVKNINSFRYLERALEYEIDRQVRVVEGGGVIVQETRLWDAAARETFSMRTKEDAHDYRYFPEPDLPPVQLARDRIDAIRGSIVELPEVRRQRVIAQYALSDLEVTALENTELTALFEETAEASGHPRGAFNWVSGEVARKL
ncbi:MAG: Asp-tRNA(Asn)/Glu-tRNA(Gln) amidotransferase subunit GatB, partial [Acidobacteria bacterium]